MEMRSQPWRRDLASYATRSVIPPRITDVDTLQHMNNVALLGLHHEARTRWQMSALGAESWKQMQPMLRPLSITADFLEECNFPEVVETGVQLTHVDNNGWRVSSALFQPHCVGTMECEMTAWQNGERCAVPDETLSRMRAQPLREDAVTSADDMEAKPLSAYVKQIEVQSRYSDHDPHGFLSELAIARYTEHARYKLISSLFHHSRGTDQHIRYNNLVANVRIQFLRHARSPTHWQMGTEIVKIGRSSIKLRTAIFDGDVCHVLYDCVIVIVDRSTHSAVEIPDRYRSYLAELQLQ